MIVFKKILSIILVTTILTVAQDISWFNPSGDTFHISTEAHLQGLAQLVNSEISDFSEKTIILIDDITLTGNHTPIGNNLTNTRRFLGIFDGNSKAISNLSISSGNWNYAGLFGYVGTNGQIKNLTVNVSKINVGNYAGGLAAFYASIKPIENCGVNIEYGIHSPSILSGSITYYLGGLIGYGDGAITITNSYTTGNVSDAIESLILSSSNSCYSGGLIGYVNGTIEIINSYTTGNVSSSARPYYGNYHTYSYSGGLVGNASATIAISNSYSTGNITSAGRGGSGGLVGHGIGSISNSYTMGNVYNLSDNDYSGGLVGIGGGVITNCYAGGIISGGFSGGIFGEKISGTSTSVYYNSAGASSASGKGSSVGMIALGSEQLKNSGNFIGWDFENIWGIDPEANDGFPHLRWAFPRDTTTSIYNVRKSNNFCGIRFAQNIVSDRAEINVVLPNNEGVADARIVVYDMAGNAVFVGSPVVLGFEKPKRSISCKWYIFSRCRSEERKRQNTRIFREIRD